MYSTRIHALASYIMSHGSVKFCACQWTRFHFISFYFLLFMLYLRNKIRVQIFLSSLTKHRQLRNYTENLTERRSARWRQMEKDKTVPMVFFFFFGVGWSGVSRCRLYK